MRKAVLNKWRIAPVLMAALLAFAVVPDVLAQTKEQAARQAAKQYNAKVLSVKESKNGHTTVYVIKMLTKDGVVKTIRVPKKY